MGLKQIYKKVKSYFPPIMLNKLADVIHVIDFQKYRKIISKNKNYKNKYVGERCFILGSAPSIATQNITYLKNENLFAMNNFCVHKDFDLIFSGDGEKFYIDSPNHPPATEEDTMIESKRMDDKTKKNVIFFLGINRYKNNLKYIVEKYKLFKNKKINYYYVGATNDEFSKLKEKHFNIDKIIVSSFTCFAYTLIIAIYMGFKEIYVLGCDHNYILFKNQEDSHFFKSSGHKKEVKNIIENLKQTVNQRMAYGIYRMLKLYNEIKVMNPDVKIINLSPTSLIDTFEKEDYNHLLQRLNLKNGKN